MQAFSRSLQMRIDRLSIPEPNTGCFLWFGPVSRERDGYGGLVVRPQPNVRRFVGAHVIAFELRFGAVPEGLVVDHKCNNTLCVNPDHLRAITQRENLLRGSSIQACNACKTHCKHGHPFSGENLMLRKGGGRACRECNRLKEQRRRERSKELPQ